ncbi:hypothetical protein RFI_07950 [Reticulomyxa filosa]|uniref:Uncharacterized protein n=1 Tax=Reticulomyxa filosa TaxID=46433 RepID=X6NV66_RETFI|nr:hypothetical protein RFI_07950 [Reticulomyxa filosa]|eukprot:ETO29177.1 hypothetical protein RFI_07950 [Reticulomyxa filosa]
MHIFFGGQDELQAELDELEELEADELLSDMPATSAKKKVVEKETEVPDIEVPTHKVAAKKKTEDDELAELEAMIG